MARQQRDVRDHSRRRAATWNRAWQTEEYPNGAVEVHPTRRVLADLRPVGELRGESSARLDEALRALTECASMVIVDLDAARVGDQDAALVMARAADRLAERDGMLLLVNAREGDRAMLAKSGQQRGLSITTGPLSIPAADLPPTARRTALCTVTDDMYEMPLG